MAASEVEISPSDLKFRFALNKQLLATININNPLGQRVAFKIKTTAPKKYVVRPSSGVAEPRSSVSVQVIMQAQKEYPADFANCRDKFMIQVTPLGEGEAVDKDSFNKEVRKDLHEHRLRVIMEGPAAPPSPVPEANEGADGEDNFRSAAAGGEGVPSAGGPPGAGAATSSGEQERAALRTQLERVKREREDLRKQLDAAELAAGGKGGQVAKRSTLPILQIILVAIISYILGHYMATQMS